MSDCGLNYYLFWEKAKYIWLPFADAWKMMEFCWDMYFNDFVVISKEKKNKIHFKFRSIDLGRLHNIFCVNESHLWVSVSPNFYRSLIVVDFECEIEAKYNQTLWLECSIFHREKKNEKLKQSHCKLFKRNVCHCNENHLFRLRLESLVLS